MKRSLRKYFKTTSNRKFAIIQEKKIILIVSCIRRKYYSSLKLNRVTDNKAFGKL